MFVTITSDQTNAIEYQRRLDGWEVLNPRHFAKAYADMLGIDLSDEDGHVPAGCGDFTVEIAEEPLSARYWASASFFFDHEGC